MKFSYGCSYKEAICGIPAMGYHMVKDRDAILMFLMRYDVVLDYKQVKLGKSDYTWRYKGPYCYMVFDEKKKQPVMREDKPDKVRYFKSISRAMEWIYDHNKEFYDSIPNLSTKKKKGE